MSAPSAGVAIRTTYANLNDCLGDDPDIAIARVRYIDFKQAFAGINDAIFRKRHSRSHENEVRAVIREPESSDKLGLLRPIAVNRPIDQVVVSPFASAWFEEVLKETLGRFGSQIEVGRSEIAQEPFF